MDKRSGHSTRTRSCLLPSSLDDRLPQDHLARFVADLVDEVLELGPVPADCTEERGYPPYEPGLMLRLLIYGHTTGVRSSPAIERYYAEDIAFRFLAADQAPDFRSIQVPPPPGDSASGIASCRAKRQGRVLPPPPGPGAGGGRRPGSRGAAPRCTRLHGPYRRRGR